LVCEEEDDLGAGHVMIFILELVSIRYYRPSRVNLIFYLVVM
jgi:hypothetical protein